MAGEEPVDEADLVGEKKAEAETKQARAGDEPAIEPGETRAGVGKGKRQRASDQHHSGDGAQTKNQKIKDAPAGFADGAQHEERYGSGTRQPMDDADEEWAQGVK